MTMSNLTPAHLIRATIEGVSFGILNGLDLILAGRPAQVIKVIGGGSRSKAWRQLLADATGAVIQVPTEDEAGCLGAAIQAMVAYSHVAGSPKDFVSVTERLTHVAESETCYPRGKFLEPYTQARLAYAQALSDFYSVR
jgi:xylulokinase